LGNALLSRDLGGKRLCGNFQLIMCRSDQRKNDMCRLLTTPTSPHITLPYESEDYGSKQTAKTYRVSPELPLMIVPLLNHRAWIYEPIKHFFILF